MTENPKAPAPVRPFAPEPLVSQAPDCKAQPPLAQAQPATSAQPEQRPPLAPAALRALAEAEARRAAAHAPRRPAELGGRDGPEPVRYGDWEKNGLAIDF